VLILFLLNQGLEPLIQHLSLVSHFKIEEFQQKYFDIQDLFLACSPFH